MGSYTYFNTYHIYPLFCIWADQIREPLSHFFFFLIIYLWEDSSILIPLSIIQVSKTFVYLLLSILLLLLLLLYEFSIIIIIII